MSVFPRRKFVRAAGHDRCGGERGAALVEFAFLLPFLLVITVGVIDLGRAYTTWVQLANAAHEGAVYAQTHPLAQAPNGANCADPNNVTYHALTENGTKRTDLTVAVTPWVGCVASGPGQAINPGDTVKVTVSKPFVPITPLLSSLIGPLTISSSVTMVVQG